VVDHAPAEQEPTDPGARPVGRPRPAGPPTAEAVTSALARAADQMARMEKNLLAADEQMTHLRIALESNRRIGMAIGVLMALRKVDEQAAFELLKRSSSRRNVKLRLVAEEVIRTGTLG
jgi:AmiR/NasT family two-component response regulator